MSHYHDFPAWPFDIPVDTGVCAGQPPSPHWQIRRQSTARLKSIVSPSMSAIETISRFKLPLMIAEGLFSALALVAVALLRDGDIVRLDEPLPLLFLVSTTGAALCFFPLCYWSWFRRPDSSIWRWPRVIFYWVLLAGALVGWANFMAVAWSNA